MVASESVKGFFGAMKDQPIVLALCVMNFALIGFIYYLNGSYNAQRETNVKLWVGVQSEMQKLLSQCVIPAPMQRGDLSQSEQRSELAH